MFITWQLIEFLVGRCAQFVLQFLIRPFIKFVLLWEFIQLVEPRGQLRTHQ